MSDTGDLLYDPTAEPRILTAGLAPRLASLQGTRAGILDNSKANAGTLMLAVVQRLKERYGVRDVIKREKGIAGPPSPSIMAYPWPAGATAHSGRASATGFRPASVALKAKRTTSPVRTDASAGATATCATAFGTTVIDQLSLAEPAPAVIVARPGARA